MLAVLWTMLHPVLSAAANSDAVNSPLNSPLTIWSNAVRTVVAAAPCAAAEGTASIPFTTLSHLGLLSGQIISTLDPCSPVTWILRVIACSYT